MFTMRFDMRAPGATPDERARLYDTALEMAAWAETRGCLSVVVSEHHVSDDGYVPSPLTLAAAMAAVTTSVPIMVAAALLPLYDPVRLAEDMVVLDHLSRGRIAYTLAVGYRPVEYELHGVDYHRRGAIADEHLAVLLRHLRQDPAGDGPLVTPAPFSPGGPMLCWGGSSRAAARRAGRNGLGFISQSPDPELEQVYRDACAAGGHEPGLCAIPPADALTTVFVHPDPDEGWREVGEAMLADAVPYHRWNVEAGMVDHTVSLSSATTVDAMREENGSHRVLSIEEAAAMVREQGLLSLMPLCGGLDPDLAWTYLRRVVDDVLPAAANGA